MKYVFKMIVKHMINVHKLGVYHRDLKPENIIIYDPCPSDNEGDNIKISIIDWEYSEFCITDTKGIKRSGSPIYVAPEVLNKERYYGPENDIWSLGIILYIMMEKIYPWTSHPEDYLELYEQIMNYEIDYDIVHKEFIPLYKSIFVPYKERISLELILEHDLLK
jgi:MAP/microtubule affinity-regulating kinase